MDDLVFVCVSCGKGLVDYDEFCKHTEEHEKVGKTQKHTTGEGPCITSNCCLQNERTRLDYREGKKSEEKLAPSKELSSKPFDIRDVEQTCNEILEVAAARQNDHPANGSSKADFITHSERQTLQEASKLILLNKLRREEQMVKGPTAIVKPTRLSESSVNSRYDLSGRAMYGLAGTSHLQSCQASSKLLKSGTTRDLGKCTKQDHAKFDQENELVGVRMLHISGLDAVPTCICDNKGQVKERTLNTVATDGVNMLPHASRTHPLPEFHCTRQWTLTSREELLSRVPLSTAHVIPMHIPSTAHGGKLNPSTGTSRRISETEDMQGRTFSGAERCKDERHRGLSPGFIPDGPLPFISDVRSLSGSLERHVKEATASEGLGSCALKSCTTKNERETHQNCVQDLKKSSHEPSFLTMVTHYPTGVKQTKSSSNTVNHASSNRWNDLQGKDAKYHTVSRSQMDRQGYHHPYLRAKVSCMPNKEPHNTTVSHDAHFPSMHGYYSPRFLHASRQSTPPLIPPFRIHRYAKEEHHLPGTGWFPGARREPSQVNGHDGPDGCTGIQGLSDVDREMPSYLTHFGEHERNRSDNTNKDTYGSSHVMKDANCGVYPIQVKLDDGLMTKLKGQGKDITQKMDDAAAPKWKISEDARKFYCSERTYNFKLDERYCLQEGCEDRKMHLLKMKSNMRHWMDVNSNKEENAVKSTMSALDVAVKQEPVDLSYVDQKQAKGVNKITKVLDTPLCEKESIAFVAVKKEPEDTDESTCQETEGDHAKTLAPGRSKPNEERDEEDHSNCREMDDTAQLEVDIVESGTVEDDAKSVRRHRSPIHPVKGTASFKRATDSDLHPGHLASRSVQDTGLASCEGAESWESLLCREDKVPLSPSRTSGVERDKPNREDQDLGSRLICVSRHIGATQAVSTKRARDDITGSKSCSDKSMTSVGESQQGSGIHFVCNTNIVALPKASEGSQEHMPLGTAPLATFALNDTQTSGKLDERPSKAGSNGCKQIYECDVCGMPYGTYEEMFLHRRYHNQLFGDQQHLTQRKVLRALCPRYIVCQFCDTSFQTTTDYSNHLAFHCKKGLVDKSLGQNHDQSSEVSHTDTSILNMSVSGTNLPAYNDGKLSLVESQSCSLTDQNANKRPTEVASKSNENDINPSLDSNSQSSSRNSDKQTSIASLTSLDDTCRSSKTEGCPKNELHTAIPSSLPGDQVLTTNTESATGKQVISGPVPVSNFLVGSNIVQGHLIITPKGAFLVPTAGMPVIQTVPPSPIALSYRPLRPKEAHGEDPEKRDHLKNIKDVVVKDTARTQRKRENDEGTSSSCKRLMKRRRSQQDDFYNSSSSNEEQLQLDPQKTSCPRCETKFMDTVSLAVHLKQCTTSRRYNFREHKTSYCEFYESDESTSDD